MSRPDDEPIDVNAVRADDQIVEHLRQGNPPPKGDEVAEMFAALRDEARTEPPWDWDAEAGVWRDSQGRAQ